MTHPIMTLLATGVPLTLLLDLQHPAGPDSHVIYLLEQPRSERQGSAEVIHKASGASGASGAVDLRVMLDDAVSVDP